MKPHVILPKQSHFKFYHLSIRSHSWCSDVLILFRASIFNMAPVSWPLISSMTSPTCSPASPARLSSWTWQNTASTHSSLTHQKSKASYAEHYQYFVQKKMWAKYLQLTFKTVRVILKSLPPQIRNPHGAGPVKFTRNVICLPQAFNLNALSEQQNWFVFTLTCASKTKGVSRVYGVFLKFFCSLEIWRLCVESAPPLNICTRCSQLIVPSGK